MSAFWQRMLADITTEEAAHVVNLAHAQSILEGLAQNPVVGPAMVRPDDAADLDTLRAVVEAGRLRGIEPDEGALDTYTALVIEGWYLTNHCRKGTSA